MKTCTVCGTEWSDDTKFCPNDGSTLRSASGTADIVGSVIADRYHVEQKLGEGGMGAVYLGTHVKMGRKSAIKVMSLSMANDPEAIARFNREAANAARINHPNVCAIYDFGETTDGLIYLAMEFIEGESLSDTLKRQGTVSFQHASNILRQTADALRAAHDLGIVHRDLKPDNIMVTQGRDGSDVVKVVDFGIAKAMTGEEGQKVTRTGLVIGTPEYMSPEQLSGDKLDGRSDIYSLGLVFFRMLTGSLPFQADSAQETMVKRLTDPPLKLTDVLPDTDWPPRLQGILDRALQRMPVDRYGSATLFAEDVAGAVREMASPSAAVDTEGATQLMDSGATEQLLPTRASGAQDPPTPETPVPQPAPTVRVTPKRKKPVVMVAASIAVLVAAGGGAAVVLQSSGGKSTLGDDSTSTLGGQPVVTAGTDLSTEQRDTDTPAARGGQTPTPRDEATGTEAGGVAAVSKELFDMIETIDAPATRPRAMLRAEDLYNDTQLPDSLRASAASMLAFGHDLNGSRELACDWIGRAVQRDVTNARFLHMRDTVYACSNG